MNIKNYFENIFGYTALRQELAQANSQLALYMSNLDKSDSALSAARKDIKDLEGTLSHLKEEEETLRKTLKGERYKNSKLQAKIDFANLENKKAAKLIAGSQDTIVSLQAELDKRLEQFNELVQAHSAQAEQIARLEAQLKEKSTTKVQKLKKAPVKNTK